MKRYIKSSTQAAQTNGTTYYRVSLDDVIDYFSQKSQNVWLYKLFLEKGWKAIDLGDNLLGSFFKNGDLFICVSDGTKVFYQEKFIDPFKLPRGVDLDDLQDYISIGTDQTIHRYITPYEVVRPNFDEWTDELLAEGYTKKKLVRDAKAFDKL